MANPLSFLWGLGQFAGNAIRSPLGQFGLTAIGGNQQQQALDQFNAANQARLDQILQGFGQLGGDLGRVRQNQTMGQMRSLDRLQGQIGGEIEGRGINRLNEFAGLSSQLTNQVGGQNQALMNALQQLTGNVTGQLASRTRQGLGYLDNASGQARTDINQRFNEVGAAQQQNLVSRGLGGSVAAAIQRGNERERGAELRRFDEGVRREYLDTFSRLSGDEAAAAQELGLASAQFQQRGQENALGLAERLAAQRIGMGSQIDQDIINNLRSFGSARFAAQETGDRDVFNLRGQLGTGALGVLERVRDLPPSGGQQWMQLAQQFGQNAAGTPSGPSGSDVWGPAAISGGSSILAALLLSDRDKKSMVRDIDHDAMLAGIENLEVSKWRYKDDETQTDHIGPMAQDFKAIFGLGSSDKWIHPVDAIGVLLSAVKALSARVKELEASRGDHVRA